MIAASYVSALVLLGATAHPGLTSTQTAPAQAVAPAPAVSLMSAEARATALDDIGARALARGSAPGFQIAIMQAGRTVYDRGFGVRDIVDGAPMQSETIFPIASISKQFTAVAALMLVDDGRLNLDLPISTYLPEISHGSKVTARQLMTHTSGYAEVTELADASSLSPEEALKRATEMPLEFTPGSRFRYDNTGYILLGRLVERISGFSYGDFVRTHIFTPLEMDHSGYGWDAETQVEPIATGYQRFALGAFQAVERPDADQLAGAGALTSSATDLMKWADAVQKGRLLKPASQALLIEPFLLPDGTSTRYSSGLLHTDVSGHHALWHAGRMGGYTGILFMFPDDELTIFIFGNSDETPFNSMLIDILPLFMPDVPGRQPEPPVDTAAHSALPAGATDELNERAIAWLDRAVDGEIDRSELRSDLATRLDEARAQDLRALSRYGPRTYRLQQVIRGTPLTTYIYQVRTAAQTISYKVAFAEDGKVGEVILRAAD